MRPGPCTAIFSAFLLATPMAAQDVSGTITGTLELEPANWYVSAVESTDASGWDRTGNAVDVRLVGLASRDAPRTMEGALAMTFQIAGNPTDMNVQSFRISFFSGGDVGEDGLTYSADAANADLSVEALQISGDTMVLAGSFAGRLIEGGAEALVLDNSAPSVTVDGNFQASLPRRDAE